MIYFQMHIMWYEAKMVSETFDNIYRALEMVPEVEVDLHFCFNLQTYLEKPLEGTPWDMVEPLYRHPLFLDYSPRVTLKTDEHPFYNIADWRREEYNPEAKYTVWGESDCLMPYDFFYTLNLTDIKEPHLLTLASRPMWDTSWKQVVHEDFQDYSAPCQCPKDNHRPDCIELIPSPYKYKDIITQEELDETVMDSPVIKARQVALKIDGSLVCISENFPHPFIPEDMHFVREDTCLEKFAKIKSIPQVCITNRMKGHNYKHPLKRTNTEATRDDEVFQHYAMRSEQAMQKFLADTFRETRPFESVVTW